MLHSPCGARHGGLLTYFGSRGLARPDLLRLISVLTLAAGIVLVATFSPALRGMLSNEIQGAPANFQYRTLGVRHAQGVHYHLDTVTIGKLSRIASRQVRIAAPVSSAPENISAGRVNVDAHVEFYVGDYFQALHLALDSIHALDTGAENSRLTGIVITEGLARRLFGTDQHVLGKPLTIRNRGTPYKIDTFIVGVLSKTSRFRGLLGSQPISAWLNYRAYASLRGFNFISRAHFRTKFQYTGITALITAPAGMTEPQLRVALDNLWQAVELQRVFQTGSGFVVYPGYTLDPAATSATKQRTESILFVADVVYIVALLNFLFAILIRNVKDKQRYDLLHVLGQTSSMLLLDRLFTAFKTGIALFAISVCMVPLAFVLQKRIYSFSKFVAIDHATWATSLVYVLALVGVAWLLQFLVDVVSIRMLRAGNFVPSILARFAYQIIVAMEYVLATVLVIIAASAVNILVAKSGTDIGIFKNRASIISIAPETPPGLGVPETISGIATAISANNLALDAAYGAILKTEPAAAVGFGPIPDASAYFSMDQATLVADGRRAGICIHKIGPGWVEAADAHLVAGKSIKRTDSADMVISSRSASTLFGSAAKALGRNVFLSMGTIYKPYTVVGVASPFVVDASMVPCAVALTAIYGQEDNFNDNGGHFVVRPVVPDAAVPILKDRIDAALARAGTKLRVTTVGTSDRLWRQLLAPYTLQSAIYLLVALTGALIAISGALAQLLYAVAMRRRSNAIYSALGRKPSHIYRGFLMEFFAPIAIGMISAVVVFAWLVARFEYISGMHVAVLSLPSFGALAILFFGSVVVLHFPARRAACAEPAASLHEL